MSYRKKQEIVKYILSLMLSKGLILESSYNEFKKRLERKTDEWLDDYFDKVKEV